MNETLTTSDGLTLHVEVAGPEGGSPVVLLHGFPDSSALWRKVAPILHAAGHRTIAPDNRGYGRSDAPPERSSYRMDRLVADVEQIVEKLAGGGPVALVGHDWGAIVGWDVAGRRPDMVSRFAALSVGHPAAFRSAGFAQLRRSWYALAFCIPWLPEKLLPLRNFGRFAKASGDHPEVERWRADLSRPGRVRTALNWYRANVLSRGRGALGRVRVPVLGVWSDGDVALTEAQMTGSAEHCDDFRYERIDGASHWIPLDEPARLGALLVDFLSSD